MKSTLSLYNTLSRRKERFEPLEPPFVGLYVCGPTVYGDPHLGHARPAVTFDLLFRYLKATGYKVRYVRNITDVGHLEHDADEGEDKIAKKARLEQLEPMEVAQYYTDRYHDAMRALNVLPPSIEPRASSISTSRLTTASTAMASCRAACSTRCRPTRERSTVRATSGDRSISRCGKKPRKSISCAGRLRGATDSPVGIWSAPR